MTTIQVRADALYVGAILPDGRVVRATATPTLNNEEYLVEYSDVDPVTGFYTTIYHPGDMVTIESGVDQ